MESAIFASFCLFAAFIFSQLSILSVFIPSIGINKTKQPKTDKTLICHCDRFTSRTKFHLWLIRWNTQNRPIMGQTSHRLTPIAQVYFTIVDYGLTKLAMSSLTGIVHNTQKDVWEAMIGWIFVWIDTSLLSANLLLSHSSFWFWTLVGAAIWAWVWLRWIP